MEIRSRKQCVNGARGQPFVLICFPICFICMQESSPCFHLKLPFLEGQSLSFPLMCRNKHDPVIFLPQAPPAYMLWVTDFYLCEEFEIKLEVGEPIILTQCIIIYFKKQRNEELLGV